jgi:hypothetical protein
MLTIVQMFRDCGVCYKWKTPHKKKIKQHLVDITTLQPRKKSGRIVARPQASMAKKRGSSMPASKNKCDTNNNKKLSKEQYDNTSFEYQQQIILLKEGCITCKMHLQL